MNVVIVGAGLAGPLLAQGLHRAGIDVALYERDPADRAGQGYRIHLAPDGDLALRACLPPSLYDRVLATAGRRGSGWRRLDPGLRVLQEFLVPASPDEERTGRHLTVDRLTLRRILLTGVDVRYAVPFQRYVLLDDDRVRVSFANGEVIDADLLVAADGTHSRVRAQLLPDAEVVETGQRQIYGRTTLTDEVRALTPPAALDGFCVVAGTDGRSMPLAAHEFPAGDGLPAGDDYLMWVVGAPVERFPADVSTMDMSGLAAVAAALVADWHSSLSKLVGLHEPGTVHTTTVRTAKPVPPWRTGPVTVMGDAIHTMVPQGTSAAVALRDAALLSRCVAARTGSLLEAVHRYEREMLAYGFAEVERSLRSST